MEDWGQDITKGAYYSSKYMNDHISELGNQCSALLTELSSQRAGYFACEFLRNPRM